MNTIKKIKIFGFTVLLAAILLNSCSLEPEFYSQLAPNNFYESKENVYQRFYRPFTHWRSYMAGSGAFDSWWGLQEFGTDEFCHPDGTSSQFTPGEYPKIHHHEYYSKMLKIKEAWNGFGQGVALAWDAIDDINGINYQNLGFTDAEINALKQQLNALVASFYLTGLDLFGGVPLYTDNKGDAIARNTDAETFNFIESLLLEALPNLPKKTTLGSEENGSINQAAAAMLLARLYFNSKPYHRDANGNQIGEEMYDKVAELCQKIINGEYGTYALDDTYQETFGFFNDKSKEIIWSIPSQRNYLESDGSFWDNSVPFSMNSYLGGIEGSSTYNGAGLVPGRDPLGRKYSEINGYKLGNCFDKFEETDLRKTTSYGTRTYVYKGNGDYEGIFIADSLINPKTGNVCKGAVVYLDQIIYQRDQVARFSRGDDPATLSSTMTDGEENSCIRLIKRSPRPDQYDVDFKGNPDVPVIRLAEAYYMLAECKLRSGDKQAAADLINTVRKRYFKGEDTNPVTAANLDEYRMLDEWMIEFVGEGRRRTDLIRWNKYVTENWWDHKASNNVKLERFPIHVDVIASNNLLEQNPGY